MPNNYANTFSQQQQLRENENLDNYIGSGMDCAVIPLARYKEYSLVQTVDFFYPLVDDPRVMGKIALANVVSDIYAVGVTNIDRITMIISSPTELSEEERDIIVPLLISGFQDGAKLADCRIELQNIALNPWCIIGGIASSVCSKEEIIIPSNAKEGDLIVLTKPLGTHLATNAYIWMRERNDKYEKLRSSFTDEDIEVTYETAVKSMTYLNKNAALLMHKYHAHAATDVTGFGLLGHAKNLVDFQKDALVFEIYKLPIMKNVLKIGELVAQDSKLKAGKAVETSGGLLICLPAENAAAFCDEYRLLTDMKQHAWIVGRVLRADDKRDAVLAATPELIEVEL